jgi:hypothetical protein
MSNIKAFTFCVQSEQAIGGLLWVCASLSIVHEPFLEHACKLIDKSAQRMSPRAAATCLWALGRLRYYSQATVSALAMRMATFSTQYSNNSTKDESTCSNGNSNGNSTSRVGSDTNELGNEDSDSESTPEATLKGSEEGCSAQQDLSLARSLAQAAHACATLGAEGPAARALCRRALRHLQQVLVATGGLQHRGWGTSGSEGSEGSSDEWLEGQTTEAAAQHAAWPGRFQALTLACWSAVILDCHRDKQLMAPLLLVRALCGPVRCSLP